MRVEVRLFAILRERAGSESVEIDLDEGATAADALAALQRLPGLELLERLPVRIAVNREYADRRQAARRQRRAGPDPAGQRRRIRRPRPGDAPSRSPWRG